MLLLLKQCAFAQRRGSAKGEKDKLDILGLLARAELDWPRYRALASAHAVGSPTALAELLQETIETPELNLSQHAMAQLKKKVLPYLER
jgi:hypothetical protein